MIDFYGLTSPNVQKVFIMLEECGLAYNFKPVDVWASQQHSPEFEMLNPNKKRLSSSGQHKDSFVLTALSSSIS